MSTVLPQFRLTHDDSTPKKYILHLKYVNSSNIISHDVDLNDAGIQNGNEMSIDLNEISNGDSQIEVHFKQNGTTISTGNIRVEEAQQESRPFE